MIQRLEVILDSPEKCDRVESTLVAIGFARQAIREVPEHGHVCVVAIRDEELLPDIPLDPQWLEDYCVEIWQSVGPCRVMLDQFAQVEPTLELGPDEFQRWRERNA
jgi:hypothetical protein